MQPTDLPLDSLHTGATYFQVVPALVATIELPFPDLHARVYAPSQWEIEDLITRRRRKSLAARFGGERDFYTQRLRYLVGRTVVRVRARRAPDDDGVLHCRSVAEVVGAVSTLAAALVRRRAGSLRDLRNHVDLNLIVGLDWRIRSSSDSPRGEGGLRITTDVAKRFSRSGLAGVATAGLSNGKLSKRIRAAVGWAREAALESNEAAAIVKLATSLEALLVYGSEPPTRAISERGAFLLVDSPGSRRDASRALGRFYRLRGQIVHGSDATVPVGVFDAGLQLAIALVAIVATNLSTFTTVEAIQKWCDGRRWGEADSTIVRPRWPVVASAVKRLLTTTE